MKNSTHRLVILMSIVTIAFFSGIRHSWGFVFTLDKEAVFSIYFKMSKGNVYDEDLEDFLIALGRPTFTPFKPHEMFMKSSLRKMADKILSTTRQYNNNPLFRLTLKRAIMIGGPKMGDNRSNFNNHEMPHPTPFIRSEISNNDLRTINKSLDSIFSKIQSSGIAKTKEEILNIHIYLVPKGVDYRFDKRNIALEEVILPHRYVIFRPIGLEATYVNNPTKVLTFQDIAAR
ncbi:MAG: hypothetical protein ABII26_00625 [Pseudomonadota bacterium]